MFITINIEPLIAQPVNALARFMTTANSELCLLGVLRYLKGVKSRKIVWCTSRVKLPFVPCEIYAYSDASWADIVPLRKSSLSYLIFCNNTVFSWKASLSSVLAMSSAEAESIFGLVLRMLHTVVNSQTNFVSCNCAILLSTKIIWVLSRLQNPEISQDAQSTSSYADDFSITTSIGAS